MRPPAAPLAWLVDVVRARAARLSRRAAAGLAAAIVLVALGGLSWHFSLPRPGAAASAIHLYAGDRPIGVILPSRRLQSWVPLDRMPRSVVDAVLTAEDRRFWNHPGIDLLAIGRALRADLRRGELREGGSTITQQLARTLFLDSRRRWNRKVREAFIALLLEARYSKARILETYLNTVYLGQYGDVAVHGLPAAARSFLGKDLAALQVEEAAWLAGAIRAPNRLLAGPRPEAKKRRDEILLAMQEARLIPPAAARRAMAQPLRWRPTEIPRTSPYFVDVVARELDRRMDGPASGELHLQTTMSLPLQQAAEAAVRDGIARIERGRPDLAGRVQAAVVAIEPASGQIRALVGGRRYEVAPFNRATRAVRQPGSLFKPFVYLAAFEAARDGGRSLTPASLIADEPLEVHDASGSWEPKNIDGQFHGRVTVRRALEQSLNIPAIRVALDVGPRRVAEVARAVGIEHPLVPVPSLALGTSEVTLLEITSAFATLANNGVRASPTALAPDASAGRVAIAALPSPTQAVSAESAFVTTNLLRGVMRWGTGASSSAWGLSEVTAGKTGTTDGLRDAWFVGYTPDLVVGVWVGRDDDAPLGLTGAQAALPIWGPVMQAAVRRSPPTAFKPPPGVVLVQVDRRTGRPVPFWCGSDEIVQEAFRQGTVPPSECTASGSVFSWLERLFR
ncbi:MAG TPA: PBP1A family penicillin-binding protein [Methylomirabilota bacterium]|nr:PBP1A family penicillin-binding protein [Methylomirabilota bacterium]